MFWNSGPVNANNTHSANPVRGFGSPVLQFLAAEPGQCRGAGARFRAPQSMLACGRSRQAGAQVHNGPRAARRRVRWKWRRSLSLTWRRSRRRRWRWSPLSSRRPPSLRAGAELQQANSAKLRGLAKASEAALASLGPSLVIHLAERASDPS